MSKNISSEKSKIVLDGATFDASNLSEAGKEQLDNVHFVDSQILQKSNELQISDTARIMYTSVLKSELSKIV